jgi:hypothetical protein
MSINPLVLLSISDQYTRNQVQKNNILTTGLLIGTKSVAGEYKLLHSIAACDRSKLRARIEQYRIIHSDCEPLGLYVAGASVAEAHAVLATTPSDLTTVLGLHDFVFLEVSFNNTSEPYKLTRILLDKGVVIQREGCSIKSAPCACGKVVIGDLARTDNRGGDWEAQLNNEIGIFKRAKGTLSDKMDRLKEYQEAVKSGKVEADAELLEEIASLQNEMHTGVIGGEVTSEVVVEAIARMAVAMKRSGNIEKGGSRPSGVQKLRQSNR